MPKDAWPPPAIAAAGWHLVAKGDQARGLSFGLPLAAPLGLHSSRWQVGPKSAQTARLRRTDGADISPSRSDEA